MHAGSLGMSLLRCPSCDSSRRTSFYSQERVPVHSCLLLPTREEAERFPRGTIRLSFCEDCGCIWNTEFDPTLTAYSPAYEDSQAFSPRFRTFADELAAELVERYDVHGKRVLEIGCGKGDFLLRLCALGGNSGTGIDPAVDPAQGAASGVEGVTFIADIYSDRYAGIPADLIVCRHTLEHLPNPGDMLRSIRAGAHGGGSTIVYLEVPDVSRILSEGAFWDVYYEHCCYFSAGSLARLAGGAGLEVLDVRYGFDQQYLLLDARLGTDRASPDPVGPDDVEQVREAMARFGSLHAKRVQDWKARLASLREDGRRAALWGSGSKAVAFLTALEVGEEMECVVDINPRKQGMYMAGTRPRIVPPAFLTDHRPDVVIVMNPVYSDEIRSELLSLGLEPELLSL